MRGRKALVGAMAVAMMGLLAVVICFEKQESRPPTISVARIEPASIFDDSGLEMLLVTLSISDPGNGPLSPRLYVKDSGRTIEAKVAKRWVGVEGALWAGCELWPGLRRERLILLPAHTDSCRFRLQYSRALLTETQSVWLARRLPSWMPGYRRVFNWLRKSPYEPSRSWRKISIEVTLPLESARPANVSDGTHNESGGFGVLQTVCRSLVRHL